MSEETNAKDERIERLWKKGNSVKDIARKIGMPGKLERVYDGLVRRGLIGSDK